MKQAFLVPVLLPGYFTQQSPADQAVSQRHHHVGLLCKHLQSFLNLTDNWDGYGAVPPSEQAIDEVTRLLNNLPSQWALRLHSDGLTPTPYGTITLDWAVGADYVNVEVGDNQWAYTAEIGEELLSSPNTVFPNATLQQQIVQVLQALFPQVMPLDVPAYTA